MSEEEEWIAYCFQSEIWRDDPKVEYHYHGTTFVCDGAHAALFYCQGWNDKVEGSLGAEDRYTHPAAIAAYRMGYEDADLNGTILPLPNVLET